MHNEYEEYMMSVLGYNNRNNTDLYNENYEPNYYFTHTYNNYTRMEDNVEDLFPDIFGFLRCFLRKDGRLFPAEAGSFPALSDGS